MHGYHDDDLGGMGGHDAAAPSHAEEFKVFVGGISWQMNDQELKEEFLQFGAISASVMVDKQSGRSRGFGFVYFADTKGMEDAIAKMHKTELRGREISVTRAVPQTQTAPGTPAAALGGGRRGGDRYEPRMSRRNDRGFDRMDRGHSAPAFNDRYGYDRGAGFDRPYPADFQRTLVDRGYMPATAYGGAAYGDIYSRLGYDRPAFDLGAPRGFASDPYPAPYPSYGGRDSYGARGGAGPDRSRSGFASQRSSGPYDRFSSGRPSR